jgi:PAS domain S-box-containing protein/putative nucleotidyltransferase with HDIG domain
MRIDTFISGTALLGLVDHLLLVGPDGAILDAGTSALQCYGYPRSHLLAVNIAEIDSSDTTFCATDELRHAAEQGHVFEAVHRRADGTTFPVEVRAALVGQNGEAAYLCVVRDITARKRSEDALRASEAKHSAMISNIADVIGVMGTDGYMKYKSPNIKKWFGWDPDDLIGTDGWLTVHPDDLDRLQAEFMGLLGRPRGTSTVEYRYLCKDGSYKPIELTATNCAGDPIIDGVLLNYHDITERKALERLGRELDSIIDVIGAVTEMRDPYTAGHQRRVAELATAIASDMGMSASEIADVRVAGLMHDVGKMAVPAELLSRPRRLSTIEMGLVRGHAAAGYEIISSAKMPYPIADLVHQHHERCDGSGYPAGLHADDLLPGSTVLMVADVAEAMMSHRPYRPALGLDIALAEIADGSGSRYDADVSRSCISIFREQDFAFAEE